MSSTDAETGALEPDEAMTATLVLRPRPGAPLPDFSAVDRVEREALSEIRGADAADLELVRGWAEAQKLDVAQVDLGRRLIRLSGTAQQVQRAFAVGLRRRSRQGACWVEPSTALEVPQELRPAVVAVLGLDTTPRARPHFRVFTAAGEATRMAQAAPAGFAVPQVPMLYSYPDGTSGKGECIGLIELGGGYQQQDVTNFFAKVGIAAPELVAVGVEGGANSPTGDPSGPDGEVMLDIEVAGAAAPGVRLAVYFAPNTDLGFLGAIQAATRDTTNRPTVISISWGGPETSWPGSTITAMDHALQDAALAGITVCVAAGDEGSSDGVEDGLAHVDFPASSPHALACGGTRLIAAGEAIAAETVWNDLARGGATGGGISASFPLPDWQARANVPPSVNPGHLPGRGVPDVAGDADPQSGYQVLVDGQDAVYGGTSAVAPLWAALLVRLGQALGRSVGYLNPPLYQALAERGVTRDVTQGSNGGYQARAGWDACTGWGSPKGTELLDALHG